MARPGSVPARSQLVLGPGVETRVRWLTEPLVGAADLVVSLNKAKAEIYSECWNLAAAELRAVRVHDLRLRLPS